MIIQFFEYKLKNAKEIITILEDKLFIKVDFFGFISIYDLLCDMAQRIFRIIFDGIRRWNESD